MSLTKDVIFQAVEKNDTFDPMYKDTFLGDKLLMETHEKLCNNILLLMIIQ